MPTENTGASRRLCVATATYPTRGGAHGTQRNYPALPADRCAALAEPARPRKKRQETTWPRNRACGVAGQLGTIATSGDVGTPESTDAGLSGC